MLFFLLSWLFALPDAYHVQYLERIQTNNNPPVLVLISPGWTEQLLEPLLSQLWTEGFAVWSLRFAHHAQTDTQMLESIATAIEKHQKPFVVSQGFSGRMLLKHADTFAPHISGVALLASPIASFCSPALEKALQGGSWSAVDHPPLSQASPSFHQDLWRACQQREILKPLFTNIWAATTNGNPIVPPENIRPYLGDDHQFLRIGPLALQGSEPSYQELFAHPATLSALSSWIRSQR